MGAEGLTVNLETQILKLHSKVKGTMIQFLRVSFTCLLLCCGQVWALQGDRAEPISIESDTAERDETKGTTTYAGAVIMQQGSMKINADKVIIYSNKEKVLILSPPVNRSITSKTQRKTKPW